MQIGVIGMSHEKAPVEVRERVAFTDKQKIQVLDELMDGIALEAVILSTCNRSEVYFASNEVEKALVAVESYLQTYFQVDFGAYFFKLKNEAAIKHLYKVSTGLDSIIIGEDQILGQVKAALEFAMEIGSSKKILNKVFREAITFSKKMRTQYRLSEHPLSLAYIGVKHLKERVELLEDKKVLLVGTGEMGQLVLKYLREEGVKSLYVANRTETRGKIYAIQEDKWPEIRWVTYEERYAILPQMDVVISATSSPHRIFKQESYPKITNKQWIMDLAIPRDVDKKIGNQENIHLYNIDDLKEIANENLEKRKKIGKRIESYIEEQVIKMNQWLANTKLDPIVHSLHRLSDEVAKDTLELAHKKLDLNTRERLFLDELIHSALKRMVRTPIKALKAMEDEEEIESYKLMFERLFEK